MKIRANQIQLTPSGSLGANQGEVGVSADNGLNVKLGTTATTAAAGNHSHDLSAYAPLASPALSGTPTAPTAVAGTNTTQVATTAFVRGEVSALVDSAPGTLDTLNELAAALGDDPNYATTITTALGGKAPTVHTHLMADVTDLATVPLADAQAGTGTSSYLWTPALVAAAIAALAPAGGATSLNALSDVDVVTVTPAAGDVLTFDDADDTWKPAAPAATGVTRTRTVYTNLAGAQSSFSTGTTFADVANVDLYLSGIKLIAGSEYSADPGNPTTHVLLTAAANIGEDVEIIVWG